MKKRFKIATAPKWLKRPVKTTYLRLFRKQVKLLNYKFHL